jgi:integrase
MARPTKLLTTTLQEVREQPKVKAFLERKRRNSPNSALAYLVGLTMLQEFLNSNSYSLKLNEIDSLYEKEAKEKNNAYELIDKFISFLVGNCQLSTNTVRLYVAAVRSYLENCDIEISPNMFKNKVTMPRNHKEDEIAIDDSDIRKILLSCNNRRLKAYLLILASGGMRAMEALAIRLKDIDFSVTPTKIHIREQYSKTKTSRDIYISEEATTYLKQLIAWKYRVQKDHPSQTKIRNEEDLVFSMRRQSKSNPQHLYYKILLEFQKLLATVGLDERKEKMLRRKITLHSFRRFVKTVIANHTSTDYSEWFLGHRKSPYFVQKESEKRLLYATKCMPFLTFTNYSKLEEDASKKETEVEMLMIKDANKERELELLRQRISVKDKEIELLTQRDIMNTDSISSLSDKMQQIMEKIKELEDR